MQFLACEPIYPFGALVGGPGLTLQSLVALGLAVIVKSVLFGLFQKDDPFARAATRMVAGNVVSTLAGIPLLIMSSSGEGFFIGIVLSFVVTIPAARRLANFTGGRFGQTGISTGMTFGMVASCLLFVFAGEYRVTFGYWFFKIPAVWLALGISFVLTSFWEEWTIWKLSHRPSPFVGYVGAVCRANLIVMAITILCASFFVWPKHGLHS